MISLMMYMYDKIHVNEKTAFSVLYNFWKYVILQELAKTIYLLSYSKHAFVLFSNSENQDAEKQLYLIAFDK